MGARENDARRISNIFALGVNGEERMEKVEIS